MLKLRILQLSFLILIVIGLSIILIPGNTASAQCDPGVNYGGPGADTFVCGGTTGIIYGDYDDQSATTNNANATGYDTIINNGTMSIIYDDYALADTGNAYASGSDLMINNGTMSMIFSNFAQSLTGNAYASGNNTIINNGMMAMIFEGFAFAPGSGIAHSSTNSMTTNNGTLTILYDDFAQSVDGNATANGSDVITNNGEVIILYVDFSISDTGVATADGDDLIINNGEVQSIWADYAKSDTGKAIASGDDTVINYGVVHMDIVTDYAVIGSPSPPIDPTGNGTTIGNDYVINVGTVMGGIYLGGGDDTMVVVDGAPVYGLMDGGDGTDRLIFEFWSANYETLAQLEAFANFLMTLDPAQDEYEINGHLFTWEDFEGIYKTMQLAPFCDAWPVKVFYPRENDIVVRAPIDDKETFVVTTIDVSQLTQDPAGNHVGGSHGWNVVVYWVEDHYQINVYGPTGELLTDRCTF